MNENKTKKELQAQYKEREVIGGICAIKNLLNDKVLLETSTDLRTSRNRFEFSQKTGSCIHMKLQKDWDEHGSGQFVYEVLEELAKGATQTDREFKADLELLKELWLEKLTVIDDVEMY